jgi:hypothetical protein
LGHGLRGRLVSEATNVTLGTCFIFASELFAPCTFGGNSFWVLSENLSSRCLDFASVMTDPHASPFYKHKPTENVKSIEKIQFSSQDAYASCTDVFYITIYTVAGSIIGISV